MKQNILPIKKFEKKICFGRIKMKKRKDIEVKWSKKQKIHMQREKKGRKNL